MARPDQGWHPEDIKAELRKKFGPLTRLSRSWGLNRAAISNVLRCASESMVVERRIALALGIQPQKLWPERWGTDGRPLPRPSRQQPTDPVTAPQRQKARAA